MFLDSVDMAQHLKVVHEKRFRCLHCSKRFGSEWYLLQHVNAVHEKLKLNECNFCDKKFGFAADLSMHVKNVHLLLTTSSSYHCKKQFVVY